ncbi:MAG: DUF3459 domain-containing protein, partial [Acidobacteriales bacterium]|nr:DUF3459 domain-containing protein [Terriglobales bacterium]
EDINYDGPSSRTVRDFFIHNALYWLEEYHLDGLRFDAVHAIVDDSDPHILVELAETVRHRIAPGRHVHLVVENMHNASHYLSRDNKNHAVWYDAQWNDDIHHTLHVLTTGESDGYYSDYAKTSLQFLGRCLTEGFAYQGEISEYEGNVPRGEPSSQLPPGAFVSFLQNHDQIGNRALGERITQLARTEAVKAAMSILLLAPSPPLLFMGEEFDAGTPFFFFCDFSGDLAAAVTEGRRGEFSGFAQFKSAEARARIPDPNCAETYARSKLDWDGLNNSEQRAYLQFYRELLGLRQKTIVPLLRKGNHESKQFKTFEGTGLLAEWHFSGSVTLRLLANIGAGKINYAATLAGKHPANQILYSSSNEAKEAQTTGQLSPWAVIWTLQS